MEPPSGPSGPSDDDGVDIKNMVRTFVFLNDPRVKQVTTKFLAVALTLGALFALYAWSVTDPTAPADGAETPTAAEAWPQYQCMHASAFAAWVEEHPQHEVRDAELQPDGQTVCFWYEPRDGFA